MQGFIVIGVLLVISVIVIYFNVNNKSTGKRKRKKKSRLSWSENAVDNILSQLAEKYGGIEMSDIMLLSNGNSVQIDNMLLTQKALYVIEVKDYSGWIYGSPHQQYWTQVFTHYKARTSGNNKRSGVSKYKLYNPIKQNQGHINMLNRMTQVHKLVPVYNIVVFTDSGFLKDVESGPSAYVIYMSDLKELINDLDMQLNHEITVYEQSKIYDAIVFLDVDDPRIKI